MRNAVGENNPDLHARTSPIATTTSMDHSTHSLRRNRLHVGLVLALTVAMGLATRRAGMGLPAFVVDHFGDALWTVAVYLGLCLLAPNVRPVALAGLAFLLSVMVECSQLIEADWLNTLRSTRLGRLLLGSGFLWVDFARYFAGAVAAAAVDTVWRAWATRYGGGRSNASRPPVEVKR